MRETVEHLWPEPGGYPVKLIQVAGTSGKGSTCQFIRAGLSAYGKSGCYLKPHVFDFAERFVVEDRVVSHHEIVRAWKEIRPYCIESSMRGESWSLDHLDVSLLIALKLFEEHGLEWASIETGMGGRYDPVTALDVVATVITNVGQDHEDALGDEHWQRALEKAGICRPGIPLFCADTDSRSTEVISSLCKDVGAPFYLVTEKELVRLRKALSKAGLRADSDMLLGAGYQLWNAALAVETVRFLIGGADSDEITRKLLKVNYVGRFWRIEKGVYADIAHNPSKTAVLAEDLKARFPRSRKVFVIGISGPRDPVAVVGPLVKQAKAIVVTGASFKGQDPEKLYSRLREAFPEVPIHLAPNPATAIAVAKNLRSRGEMIVFTGSTYMIDQALNPDEYIRHLNAIVGWRDRRQAQLEGAKSDQVEKF